MKKGMFNFILILGLSLLALLLSSGLFSGKEKGIFLIFLIVLGGLFLFFKNKIKENNELESQYGTDFASQNFR